jgi:hypothetical protein
MSETLLSSITSVRSLTAALSAVTDVESPHHDEARRPGLSKRMTDWLAISGGQFFEVNPAA